MPLTLLATKGVPRPRAKGCANTGVGGEVMSGSSGLQIYDFKFIAVVFEEDYFLLKQAVGEELGGVRDNESGGEVELVAAVVNSNLFMEL